MSGNLDLKRPSHKHLLTYHDIYTQPLDLAGNIYRSLGAKMRRKLRIVAAYYDWYYEKVWPEVDETDRRWYIYNVLDKFLVLSQLSSSELTSLSTTTHELLEYGPQEYEFVLMYYRSSFLNEEERDEMREEYEQQPEQYEHHDPVPRAARFDTGVPKQLHSRE